MIDLIMIVLALSVLITASIQDLKKREVMDWLNFGLIASALLIRTSFSSITGDWSYFLNGIYGLLIGVALAYLMFYTGQWGGGDSKLLMGMGALIGYSTFLFIFMINIFLLGAVYGLIYTIILAIRKRKQFVKEFALLFKQNKLTHRILLLVCLVLVFATYFVDYLLKLPLLMIIVLSLSMFYLFLFTKSVEKSCMLKYYNPMKLTEGDWIAKDVKYKGKYLAGPKDLGIDKKQIKLIQSLYKKGKIKQILVKEGIPFVPSFLFAYIFTYAIGNYLPMFF